MQGCEYAGSSVSMHPNQMSVLVNADVGIINGPGLHDGSSRHTSVLGCPHEEAGEISSRAAVITDPTASGV